MIYSEKAKEIYNKVCDKYNHHWLDTTISQTMAMEMITEALSSKKTNIDESKVIKVPPRMGPML